MQMFAAPSLADPRPRWPWAALVPPVDTAIKRVQRTKAHEDGCVSPVHEGDGVQKSGEHRERKKQTKKNRERKWPMPHRTARPNPSHRWWQRVGHASETHVALPRAQGSRGSTCPVAQQWLQRDPPWLLPPSSGSRTKKKPLRNKIPI